MNHELVSVSSLSLPVARRRSGVVFLRLSRGWMIVLILALLAPWAVVATVIGTLGRHAPANIPLHADSTDASTPGITFGRAGPWGQLEYRRIIIAPPTEFLREIYELPPDHDWHFVNTTRADLEHLFQTAGLDPADRAGLLADCAAASDINGFIIRPDANMVRRLTPDQRAAIYRHLAPYTANLDQERSFRFCGGSVSEWLDGQGLSQRTLDLVKPLIWRNGNVLLFSDLHVVVPLITNPQERARLVEALSREATYLVRLRVPGNSDLDALVRYWGIGARENAVRPLLESLGHADDAPAVNIALLMPSLTQRRLYTYRGPSEDPLAISRDCHWTALNFFNDEPSDTYTSTEKTVEAIHSNYRPIYGHLQFGDLIVYADPEGTAFHSAVYIADDIVYTKNGSRESWPWMFLKMDEMKNFFPRKGDVQVLYYRRKDL